MQIFGIELIVLPYLFASFVAVVFILLFHKRKNIDNWLVDWKRGEWMPGLYYEDKDVFYKKIIERYSNETERFAAFYREFGQNGGEYYQDAKARAGEED